AAIQSFNGAALWQRGKRRGSVVGDLVGTGFNGAALWQRGKPVVPPEPPPVVPPASMGPRFGSAESVVIFSWKMWATLLQWGRALAARKAMYVLPLPALPTVLQWGRALAARKAPRAGRLERWISMLQWGRALAARKASWPGLLGWFGKASMGPRFGSAESG